MFYRTLEETFLGLMDTVHEIVHWFQSIIAIQLSKLQLNKPTIRNKL